MKKVFIVTLMIFLIALQSLFGSEAIGRTYTTNFPLTENPISEDGNWINGKTDGLDWSDALTTQGLAIGNQSGTNGYDDTVALLIGSWGPDQTVQATVHTVHQSDRYFEEVELRLRSSLSAHNCTGYEVLFSCRKTSNAYVQIVRWNGPLGSFTFLDGRGGYGLANGDVVKATIVGNVITAYINNVRVLQVTDNTYASGNPGMGFYLDDATEKNGDYGFTSFTASDEELCTPNFLGNPTSGPSPLTVTFTDESTGNPTAWYWDFGDGQTSSGQNPIHTYITEGTYSVSMTATNACGSNTLEKLNLISVTQSNGLTIHVSNTKVIKKIVGKNQTGQAIVTVVDSNGSPVRGAVVYGFFNYPNNTIKSGITGANGVASISADKANRGVEYCFRVTDVIFDRAKYNTANNLCAYACEGGCGSN